MERGNARTDDDAVGLYSTESATDGFDAMWALSGFISLARQRGQNETYLVLVCRLRSTRESLRSSAQTADNPGFIDQYTSSMGKKLLPGGLDRAFGNEYDPMGHKLVNTIRG